MTLRHVVLLIFFSLGVGGWILSCEEGQGRTDAKAAVWLDEVFVNDWQKNPFSPASLISVRATQVREFSGTPDYWVLVQFPAELSDQILRDIRQTLKRMPNIRVSINDTVSAADLTPPKHADWWCPNRLDADREEIEVVIANDSDGAVGRIISIVMLKKQGVAYIHRIQF